jgi:hypothetical protein
VFSRTWGHITPLAVVPYNDSEAKEYVVTISNTLKPLQLRPRVPPFNQAIWEKLGIPIGTAQQFVLSSNQTISYTYDDTRNNVCSRGDGLVVWDRIHGFCQPKGFEKGVHYCLHDSTFFRGRKPYNYSVQFVDCEGSNSTWIYDDYRMYLMHTGTKKCLTMVDKTVELLPCEMNPHSIKQMWKFEFRNEDKLFQRLYPNITMEEWEFVQEELQSRPTESVTEVEDLFNWGSFIQKTKRKENKMNSTCLTHAGNMRTVTLERCTKQDTDFSKQNQMFEYATDYTIRKFTSNMCLHIDHFLHDSLPSLIPCNKNSMRWGINELTGQFMDITLPSVY